MVYSFNRNFKWGVSTSAYQIEGGWLDGGKGLSIWDAFSHTPGKILNGDIGDVACDHFNLYRKDVEILRDLGVTSYRFSLSWPRILPDGIGTINKKGIEFYADLIDLLLSNDIEPWITLYHWDLPLVLQVEKDGWLNPDMADYFAEYANVCFEQFGNKVKNWITLNEPWVIAILGHGYGCMAPGRKSKIEPLQVAHNLLKAHAKTVKLYNDDFRSDQNGIIGISLNGNWMEPISDRTEDIEAANRSLEFQLAWFADPIYLGDYPASMRKKFGDRLPHFTDNEKEILNRSSDFFGLNHYTTFYLENRDSVVNNDMSYEENLIENYEDVIFSQDDEFKRTSMDWPIVPWGFNKLLKWIDNRYQRPEIFITENGAAFEDELIDTCVKDTDRIEYLNAYIKEMEKAIQKGIKISGYFVWSLMDNFEWAYGYSKRFGLYYTDYKTLERIPKDSALWYKNLIKKNKD